MPMQNPEYARMVSVDSTFAFQAEWVGSNPTTCFADLFGRKRMEKKDDETNTDADRAKI